MYLPQGADDQRFDAILLLALSAMHVCILGAGVVGTTSAYALLEAGHQVTLLDAMDRPAAGASLANGAQLSYSYVAPLADPSVWTQWPAYLFKSDSPLTLSVQADPAQWRWLTAFLAACNASRARQTTIALLKLAYLSRDELHRWQRSLMLSFHHRVAGKLVMYGSTQALLHAQKQIAFQAQYGSEQRILDIDACIALEPALQAAAHRWAGGVYTESEEVGDCALFCQCMLDAMATNPSFRFLSSCTIASLTIDQGKVAAVQTSRGAIQADAYVLALGANSAALALQAGFYLPVYPLKGYSITVPVRDRESEKPLAPQISITDLSRKIVYARIGKSLRVAGRVELVGMNRDIPDRAFEELCDAVRHTFPGVLQTQEQAPLSAWAGLRPATPTGVPIIDVSPVGNLYLNVGHGALGWTLACGSAAVLMHRIAGLPSPIDDMPFRFKSRP